MRADAARNRQALMDSAQRLFITRGLSVTLDDIAAEAGVNVATAYRNFANKGELVEAFLQQIADRPSPSPRRRPRSRIHGGASPTSSPAPCG
jgi:AcrR family transcriptional regulator